MAAMTTPVAALPTTLAEAHALILALAEERAAIEAENSRIASEIATLTATNADLAAVNRDAFEVYVEKVLIPELSPGAIVVMDNLSSHKGPKVRQMIEAAGASLLYLPPYSPDFNPIENAFAKLKALLRKAAERTVDGLWGAIGRSIDRFTPTECRNYFIAAGYAAT
jgi:transposase